MMRIDEIRDSGERLIEKGQEAMETQDESRAAVVQASHAVARAQAQLQQASQKDENGNYRGNVADAQQALGVTQAAMRACEARLDAATQEVQRINCEKQRMADKLEQASLTGLHNIDKLRQAEKLRFGEYVSESIDDIANRVNRREDMRIRLLSSMGIHATSHQVSGGSGGSGGGAGGFGGAVSIGDARHISTSAEGTTHVSHADQVQHLIAAFDFVVDDFVGNSQLILADTQLAKVLTRSGSTKTIPVSLQEKLHRLQQLLQEQLEYSEALYQRAIETGIDPVIAEHMLSECQEELALNFQEATAYALQEGESQYAYFAEPINANGMVRKDRPPMWGSPTSPGTPDHEEKVTALEQRVKQGFARQVDFSNYDSRTAEAVVEALMQAKADFPALTINYIGTIGTQLGRIKHRLEREYEHALRTRYGDKYTDAEYKHFAQRLAHDKMEKKKLLEDIDRAFAWSLSLPQGDTLMCEYNGIALHDSFARNYDYFTKRKVYEVAIRHKPVGCDTPKATIDHELGHELDRMLGASNDPQMQSLYAQMLHEKNAEESLSGYSKKNIREFIAEGYSEYRNNLMPRPLSVRIFQRLLQLSKAKGGVFDA